MIQSINIPAEFGGIERPIFSRATYSNRFQTPYKGSPVNKTVNIPVEFGGTEKPVLSKTTYSNRFHAPLKSSPVTKTVKIVDEYGDPLPGAHIFFDKNNGTTTDFDGFATISSNEGSRELTISFMGFNAQKFRIDQLPSKVRLEPGESLGEVIITSKPKPTPMKTDSQVPKYLFPAIGGLALLLILMQSTNGGSNAPKKVNL